MMIMYHNDKLTLTYQIWADEEIQQEFEKPRMNGGTFVKIAQRMKDAGYDRNFDQCRTTISALTFHSVSITKEL